MFIQKDPRIGQQYADSQPQHKEKWHFDMVKHQGAGKCPEHIKKCVK